MKHTDNPCDNLELVLRNIQPGVEGLDHGSADFFTGGGCDVGIRFQQTLEKEEIRRSGHGRVWQRSKGVADRFVVF
jgi:hypothetical protein